MAAAIDAVKGGESVLRAAKQFGVPRQTLGDRVSGKIVHGTNPGPKPFLTSVEEKELSSFLVDVAKAGYGKTRKQIMGLAESVARDKGRMTGFQMGGSGDLCKGSHSSPSVKETQRPTSEWTA